jgi:hypothetical protein
MGVLKLLVGDEDGATELLESLAIATAEGRDDHVGRAYVHLADIAQRHRRWDFIDPHYNAASEYCGEHGLDLWGRYFHVYFARTEFDRGRWDAALAAVPSSASARREHHWLALRRW